MKIDFTDNFQNPLMLLISLKIDFFNLCVNLFFGEVVPWESWISFFLSFDKT